MIEKINVSATATTISFLNACKKINEIIDYCNSYLEQCPVNEDNNSIKDRLDLHKEKLENIYDYIKYFKNERCSMDELVKHSSEMEEAILGRLERLEEKAILKPDYDPDDVAFKSNQIKTSSDWNLIYKPKIRNEIAEEGTFEWALIQMKNGKKIKRGHWGVSSLYMENNKIFICDHIFQSFKELTSDICMENIIADDWKVLE